MELDWIKCEDCIDGMKSFVDICNRRIAEAREKLLQAQTSVLEGLDDGDNNQWGDNERDGVEV